ncbi:type II CRISPR RNA-guided endonuclease Cas9 [Pelagibacterium halotolerans]|uniref:type II CRISPR RNA-guided endonuclease Cas9 n=1 Tax=Pelagibacterium halotolerans TaxID=531813 RepID=UPI00384A88F7
MENFGLAFDLGTNSVGWAAFHLNSDMEPNRLIDAGVRIFSDGREPKSGNSLAEGRRVARGMARRRERYKRRRRAVIRTLAEYGLMPDTPEARKTLVAETNDRTTGGIPSDVYALRARALDEKLPLHLVGRALFHLNQRRGFKSNRKTDRRDNEQGKIATGIAELQKAMDADGARTLGEYLFKRRGGDPRDRKWVRVRSQIARNEKDKDVDAYGFYPQRAMLEEEFKRIWEAQAAYYPDVFTEERQAHLFRVIFHQRPLKPPKVGKCSFNPAEERIAKAHPLFQRFRLYKEVNELEIVLPDLSKRKLTLEERDALVNQLRSTREATFATLRKTLKLPHGTKFNKETENRSKMKGDEVAAELSHKSRFGQGWFDKTLDEQWEIIGKLRTEDDPLALNAWLEERFGFDPARRDAVAGARLPDGYGRLGPTAMETMLDALQTEVISEAKAAETVGYDHALARTGDGLDDLPKYQEVLERRIPPGSGEADDPYDIRMGRITNPTVHIALNQLRRVVNALIRKYGKPERIAIELARDLKLSEREKGRVNAEIRKNTREAERRSHELREDFRVEDNGYNRAILRFWEELGGDVANRVCVYCGEGIGAARLFSGDVDIDHILPWSQTLDDSRANRILCHRHCNRIKGNRAPADVPEWADRYDAIVERANKLPPNKRWRFARDAMERFAGDRDFLARQLTDTQYLSRMAQEYLAALYPDEEPDQWGVFKRRNHVRIVPGRLTEMLRRTWGLNSVLPGHNAKNRNDHRHHAIDAIVVGVTNSGMLNRISREAARGADVGAEDALRRFEPPWENFREDVKAVVERIVVSHKPDHGRLPTRDNPGSTAGQLHNDTAYGFTGEERNGVPVVVRRKPFLSLEPKDIASIRDDQLRRHLETETYGLSGKAFSDALRRIQENDRRYKGIRRARVTEVVSVIPIKDKNGKPYKGYAAGGNFRCDIWELPDGKWDAEVVSVFDAHRSDYRSPMTELFHNPRKVMSLRQGDMVAYTHPENGGRIIARVRKFDQRNKQIYLDAHNEAGELDKRHKDEDDPFRNFSKTPNALRAIEVRQVRVDEIGRVLDPGPQDRESRNARKSNY